MKLFTITLFLFLSFPFKMLTAETIRSPIRHHTLKVEIDTSKHRIRGVARLKLPKSGGKLVGFLLNKDFKINYPTVNGVVVEQLTKHDNPADVFKRFEVLGDWDPETAVFWTGEINWKELKADEIVLEIVYAGELYTPPDNRQFSREQIAMEVKGTIGIEGVYLSPSAYWYPTLPGTYATYKVTTTLPRGWNCVTNGMPGESGHTSTSTRVVHDFKMVSGAISLSAGPYEIKKEDHNNITLATYFLPQQADLADGYLEACHRYIDMYEGMISKYPFEKFAVVDNFLPSGYGMPGWTLLGSEVIRLPFIKDISLGHEVLHNWWGNSLFVDYSEGNWCEGLTVYLADYKYKEDVGPTYAAEYRMNQLSDYDAYVNQNNVYPLAEFSERREAADRAIGYGKVMMVFHMLRRICEQRNDSLFLGILADTYNQHKFTEIGWSDWNDSFSEGLGRRMDWFFDQWVHGTVIPVIKLGEGRTAPLRGSWAVGIDVFTVSDASEPYRYLTPFEIITSEGSHTEWVEIKRKQQRVDFTGKGELISIQLDPHFDIFRHIYKSETPVTLSDYFGDPNGVFVIPDNSPNLEMYKQVAEGLKKEGQSVVSESEFNPEEFRGSLWIFGDSTENHIRKKLFNQLKGAKFTGDTLVIDNKKINVGSPVVTEVFPYEHGVMVSTMTSAGGDIIAGTRMLSHYGKYSYLVFEGRKNVLKGKFPPSGDNPLLWRNNN